VGSFLYGKEVRLEDWNVFMLAPGSRIGDYELLRYIATGAMSEVYEGRRSDGGPSIAVKVMHEDLCAHADLLTRFHNEARALEALRNARLIAILAWGMLPEGPPYMVLEWLPHSLEQALERAGGLVPSRVAARAGAQIAQALAALHDRGVIHRDVKPANVLLAEEDLSSAELKLADLGLCKVFRESATGAKPENAAVVPIFPLSTGGSDLLGTWEYMAPEQWIQSKSAGPKADVYSLGVLLFQMVAGRLPFTAEEQRQWMAFHVLRSPPLDLLDGRASPPLWTLIARMLSKKAADRPTMRESAEELAALQ
jgi:eukaryotic-like serine/threonine-protein kinase